MRITPYGKPLSVLAKARVRAWERRARRRIYRPRSRQFPVVPFRYGRFPDMPGTGGYVPIPPSRPTSPFYLREDYIF